MITTKETIGFIKLYREDKTITLGIVSTYYTASRLALEAERFWYNPAAHPSRVIFLFNNGD